MPRSPRLALTMATLALCALGRGGAATTDLAERSSPGRVDGGAGGGSGSSGSSRGGDGAKTKSARSQYVFVTFERTLKCNRPTSRRGTLQGNKM